MRLRLCIVVASWLVAGIAFAKPQKKEVEPRQPTAAEVKLILEAPGATYCSKNAGKLSDRCEARDKGLRTFMQVYMSNPDVGLSLLRKRLEKDPDPHGVFFALLAASQTREKELVPDLERFIARKEGTTMGAYATQAISIIKTGECTSNVPAKLVEICPAPM